MDCTRDRADEPFDMSANDDDEELLIAIGRMEIRDTGGRNRRGSLEFFA